MALGLCSFLCSAQDALKQSCEQKAARSFSRFSSRLQQGGGSYKSRVRGDPEAGTLGQQGHQAAAWARLPGVCLQTCCWLRFLH